jgi:hypothetical protein
MEGRSSGNNGVFGVILPLANLPPDSARSIYNDMISRKMYTVDFRKTKKISYNYRSAYQYDVLIDVPAQIAVTKSLVTAMGLTPNAPEDPASYKGQTISVRIIIDKWSMRVAQILAPDGSTAQKYMGYNSIQDINVPKVTMTLAELQDRLSNKLKTNQ